MHKKIAPAQGQGKKESTPIIGAICATGDAARKAQATMQARAALAGFELIFLGDGWVLGRWGRLTHRLADLDAVAAALDRITGGRP